MIIFKFKPKYYSLIIYHINQIMIPKYLVVILILFFTFQLQAQICQLPQKGLFMSYNALSKRDTMNNLFNEINAKAQKYNTNYTENKVTYKIMNMHPQLYYNQHQQKQNYVDEHRINVTLGDIQFAYRFDYQIVFDSNTTSSGWARGRTLLQQQRYFIKRLYSNQGKLQWDPQEIQQLHLVMPISIQYSNPQITQQQKTVFTNILNGYLGDAKIKETVMAQFNKDYKQTLKTHLNSQDLVNDLEITYKFGNITLDFINAWTTYSLSFNKDKGLDVFYRLQVKDAKSAKCLQQNITFDQKNRGLQEVIALAQLQNGFLEALRKGLFDLTLDSKWQVPELQFYMGDLTRAFQAAYKYNPNDPFSIICQWDKDQKLVTVTKYPNHQLFAQVGETCTIKHEDKQLFKFDVDLSFSTQIKPQTQTLDFIINGANNFMPNFQPIDPQFVVSQQNLARNAVSVVLQGMIGKKAFGSGWPIYSRRFPVVKVQDQFLIIFDPSEL